MTRRPTTTEKVPTSFGALYAHVEFTPAGAVATVRFSHPGKFGNTEFGDALDALANSVNAIIEAERKGA